MQHNTNQKRENHIGGQRAADAAWNKMSRSIEIFDFALCFVDSRKTTVSKKPCFSELSKKERRES